MSEKRLSQIEQHLRGISQQVAVAGHDPESGVLGPLEMLGELRRLQDKIRRWSKARKAVL